MIFGTSSGYGPRLVIAGAILAYSAAAGPEDPDGDISVTARTDWDGATIRPARFIVAHAFDSGREASLTGFERMPHADRHAFNSVRSGRLPAVGSSLRLVLSSSGRAGEAASLKDLVLTITTTKRVPRAADTTNRTDSDGATLRPAAMSLRHQSDGARDAELVTTGASVQDRRALDFPCSATAGAGIRHRLVLESDGRAGSALALKDAILTITTTKRDPTTADTTTRTDADGATMVVAPFTLFHTADDLRDASLVTTGASAQDRYGFLLPAAATARTGTGQRIVLETDGRAGNAAALKDIDIAVATTKRDPKAVET